MQGTNIIDDFSVYTDWGPRQGDNLIVQFEVLGLSTNATVTVTGWTKNSDQADSSTDQVQLGSGGSPASLELNSKGLAEIKFDDQDIKDEVRLKIVGTAGAGELNWLNYRLLAMIWFDSAATNP